MWSQEPCKCGSKRILNVNAKCSDACQVYVRHLDIDVDGYVPSGLPFSGDYGDYVELSLCLDCGTLQGEFPISDSTVTERLG